MPAEVSPHPGWSLTRVLVALAVLAEWLPRGPQVAARYSTQATVLGAGPLPLGGWHAWTPLEAWTLFALIVTGALVLLSGRFNRTSIVAIFLASSSLLFFEGVNTKAHDRLLGWNLMVLLFAPGAGTRTAPATHHATSALRLVYCALYAGTGFSKLLTEPAWLSGSALGWHLLTPNFGNSPLDIVLSPHTWLLAPLGWFTLAFECSFFVLVWFGPTRRWLLLGGVAMHLGIQVLMDVGGFAWVSLAAYPALLSAVEAEGMWRSLPQRVQGLLSRCGAGSAVDA